MCDAGRKSGAADTGQTEADVGVRHLMGGDLVLVVSSVSGRADRTALYALPKRHSPRLLLPWKLWKSDSTLCGGALVLGSAQL